MTQELNRYKVEFTFHDRNNRGFHLKNAKRTVQAKSESDAIHKIELSLGDRIILPKVTLAE